jgi:hypothetical protein
LESFENRITACIHIKVERQRYNWLALIPYRRIIA